MDLQCHIRMCDKAEGVNNSLKENIMSTMNKIFIETKDHLADGSDNLE